MPARLLDTKVEAAGERVLELADAIEGISGFITSLVVSI